MASEQPLSPQNGPELSTLTIFCIFKMVYERVVRLIALLKKKLSKFTFDFGLLHTSRASQITKGVSNVCFIQYERVEEAWALPYDIFI